MPPRNSSASNPTLLASMQGYNPPRPLSLAARVLFSTDRPSFSELEGHVKGKEVTAGIALWQKKLSPSSSSASRRAGHAAHGGAWKIAYADFVTAMMAFFLLMWLLGSTAKGELGHFRLFQFAAQSGHGWWRWFGQQLQRHPGAGNDLSKVHGQVRRSDTEAEKARRQSIDAARAERAKQDARKRIKTLQAKIDALITENPRLNEYKSQIRIDVTPDGLQIQIVDDQNRPMFDSGSAMVKPMRDIFGKLARRSAVGKPRQPCRSYRRRALQQQRPWLQQLGIVFRPGQCHRRELVAAGMPDAKLGRVVGLAANDLLEPDNPGLPPTAALPSRY